MFLFRKSVNDLYKSKEVSGVSKSTKSASTTVKRKIRAARATSSMAAISETDSSSSSSSSSSEAVVAGYPPPPPLPTPTLKLSGAGDKYKLANAWTAEAPAPLPPSGMRTFHAFRHGGVHKTASSLQPDMPDSFITDPAFREAHLHAAATRAASAERAASAAAVAAVAAMEARETRKAATRAVGPSPLDRLDAMTFLETPPPVVAVAMAPIAGKRSTSLSALPFVEAILSKLRSRRAADVTPFETDTLSSSSWSRVAHASPAVVALDIASPLRRRAPHPHVLPSSMASLSASSTSNPWAASLPNTVNGGHAPLLPPAPPPQAPSTIPHISAMDARETRAVGPSPLERLSAMTFLKKSTAPASATTGGQ
jgi:hypothetical protein